MKNFMDLGGPFTLVAYSLQHASRTLKYINTGEPSYRTPYQTLYDSLPQSYVLEMEIDDEEAFQNPQALVSQQFNKLPPPKFCKNKQFTRPPFNCNDNPKNNPCHYYTKPSKYPSNASQEPQYQTIPLMLTNFTEVSHEDKPFETSVFAKQQTDEVLICHNCLK